MTANFSLARRLRAGETVYSAWCRLAIPMVAELLARHGYAAVTFDQQHGLFDLAATQAAIMAVHSVHGAPVVRIPVGDNANASRVLDAGVEAVIAPMIDTPEDAFAFAAAMKYQPVGMRSWGPHRAIAFSGLSEPDYLRTANEMTLAFAMIETRAGFRNVLSILEVPGIDGVFVGPSDLSITLTNGAVQNPLHPEVESALDVISDAARSKGKIAGVHCTTAERAVALAERGYRFLGVASDAGFLSAGAAAALKVLRGVR